MSPLGLPRRRDLKPDVDLELDRDLKGSPPIYIDGSEIPDRRSWRRPLPKSPGPRAEDPLPDPRTMPFVPRPASAPKGGPAEDGPA